MLVSSLASLENALEPQLNLSLLERLDELNVEPSADVDSQSAMHAADAAPSSK